VTFLPSLNGRKNHLPAAAAFFSCWIFAFAARLRCRWISFFCCWASLPLDSVFPLLGFVAAGFHFFLARLCCRWISFFLLLSFVAAGFHFVLLNLIAKKSALS